MMPRPARNAGFSDEAPLLAWYDANKRDLPWRGATDPWAVWVSETMLQQTRVETAIGYFGPFMAKFPTPAALARASMDDALKAWEGLGYYSRIRNLKAGAERVAAAGSYPRTAAQWALLPGIGPYTAAALASIVSGEPEPVADGNVVRVVSRLRALPLDPHDPRHRAESAAWLRPAIVRSGDPARFNQAIMELGETLCAPTTPVCGACPIARGCRARAMGRAEDFPKRRPPRDLPERRSIAFVVRDAEGRHLLQHRPEDGLLGGLWELPMVPARHALPLVSVRRLLAQMGIETDALRELGVVRHDFTHFRQILNVWEVTEPVSPDSLGPDFRFAEPDDLPLATASRRALAMRAGARPSRL